MSNDGFTKLAMMFKGNENQSIPSITTGTVISSPPKPKIRLNDVISLEKDDLVFGENIINKLETGNEVILIPVTDEQQFYVIDKAVRF